VKSLRTSKASIPLVLPSPSKIGFYWHFSCFYFARALSVFLYVARNLQGDPAGQNVDDVGVRVEKKDAHSRPSSAPFQ
jgi:hypothetical protein